MLCVMCGHLSSSFSFESKLFYFVLCFFRTVLNDDDESIFAATCWPIVWYFMAAFRISQFMFSYSLNCFVWFFLMIFQRALSLSLFFFDTMNEIKCFDSSRIRQKSIIHLSSSPFRLNFTQRRHDLICDLLWYRAECIYLYFMRKKVSLSLQHDDDDFKCPPMRYQMKTELWFFK